MDSQRKAQRAVSDFELGRRTRGYHPGFGLRRAHARAGDRADRLGNPTALGLVKGNPGQVLNRLLAVAIAWALAIVGTLVVLKVVDARVGLRVPEEQETQGPDLSQHGEEGYNL